VKVLRVNTTSCLRKDAITTFSRWLPWRAYWKFDVWILIRI